MADLEVDFVGACEAWHGQEQGLGHALAVAAQAEAASGLVNVLLGDDARIAALNQQFRNKAGPTNVLSFPPAPLEGQGQKFLGDIALAAETIAKEAEIQGKSFESHAAHLVVHGFLHLLGYDHGTAAEAEAMEARERVILAELGIADPYA